VGLDPILFGGAQGLMDCFALHDAIDKTDWTKL
jgi:hypothetical protein